MNYSELRETILYKTPTHEQLMEIPCDQLRGISPVDWNMLLVDAALWELTHTFPFLLQYADPLFNNAQGMRWSLERGCDESVRVLLPLCNDIQINTELLKWAAYKKNEEFTNFLIPRSNPHALITRLEEEYMNPFCDDMVDLVWLRARVEKIMLLDSIKQPTAHKASVRKI